MLRRRLRRNPVGIVGSRIGPQAQPGVRNSDAQGNPTAIYLQISKYTFIELQQANAQRPAGVNHFGLEAPNIKAAVALFKQRGAMATEPGAPSGFSHAILANVTDLNSLRIELAEMGPESLQRKAMESWK